MPVCVLLKVLWRAAEAIGCGLLYERKKEIELELYAYDMSFDVNVEMAASSAWWMFCT
jgi:hypothetical protein